MSNNVVLDIRTVLDRGFSSFLPNHIETLLRRAVEAIELLRKRHKQEVDSLQEAIQHAYLEGFETGAHEALHRAGGLPSEDAMQHWLDSLAKAKIS